jgi:formate/nitrite transporter FocA (FNT family)
MARWRSPSCYRYVKIMTTKDHYRLIAMLHLIHGCIAAATAIGVFLSVAVMVGFKAVVERWVFPIDYGDSANAAFWLYVFAIGITAVYVIGALLFTVPAIMGGYGMLKHRRWARKLVLVSAAVAALNVPFGTALAVYTFWFLLGSRAELKA